jgi:LysM repeat protein
MYRQLSLIFQFLLMLGLISCRVSRQGIVPSGTEFNALNYIEKYKELAVREMIRTGVPASITLAQGMIESDFGRSTLAREANNHFGIKCHSDWKGMTFRHHDNRRNECFRKYSNPEDSFIDHSDFLRSGSRYSFLFSLSPNDYKGWARGLKKAGYATNPDYANMLIRKIEENNLNYFDGQYTVGRQTVTKPEVSKPEVSKPEVVKPEITEPVTSGTTKVEVPVINDNFTVSARLPRVMENNRIQYIIVKDGETVEMIEKEFQLLKWELPRYNELKSDFVPVAGQILYLQPKRDKAEPGKETHQMLKGDTMYSISQKYGVKLKSLYEYNRMAEGEEAAEGQTIWLRRIKPLK